MNHPTRHESTPDTNRPTIDHPHAPEAATGAPGIDIFTESCERCDRETAHRVWLELRTESRKRRNVQYSREPYRIAACQACGETTARRMNNA